MMKKKTLFICHTLLLLLAAVLNGKALANCIPHTTSPEYNTTLALGDITVPSGAKVGDILQIFSASNNITIDPRYYWFYCASGGAQLKYTVTGTVGAADSDNAFETGVAGIGIRFKYSATGISEQTVRIAGQPGKEDWHSISGMTFYFDPGGYTAEIVKTAEQTGSGKISNDIKIEQGTDRGNLLGELTLGTGSGTIISPGCTVDDTNSSIYVDMGFLSRNIFTGKGFTTAPVPIPLTLNCPSLGTSVKVTASASSVGAYDAANGVLNLSATSGSTGLKIQLLKADGVTALPLNTPIALGSSNATQTTFNLYARYLQVSDTVTAGSADSLATFTLNYE